MSDDPLKKDIAKRMKNVRKEIKPPKKRDFKSTLTKIFMTIFLVLILYLTVSRYFW